MSEDWRAVALGDLTAQARDSVAPTAGLEYPLLGVRWYGEGAFLREIVTTESSKAARLHPVAPGQFIYNRLFAYKGAFGLITDALADCYVSNEFPLFSCAAELLPEFLFLHFQQPAVWGHVETQSVGTTASRSRWKEEQFRNYRVLLPPLPVQRRIVDLIANFDEHLNLMHQERLALEALRLTMARTVLDGCGVVALGGVIGVSQGKSLPLQVQDRRTGSVPWYKLSDMLRPGNEFGYRRAATELDPDEVIALGGRVFREGTVCFARVGAAVKTEKKRIVEEPGCLDENHIALVPESRDEGEYLLAVLELTQLSNVVRAGAVPSLNQSVIRALQVPWSHDTEQRSRLGGLWREIRLTARDLHQEWKQLTTMRLRLLSALLSRELELPEAYDALLDAGVPV